MIYLYVLVGIVVIHKLLNRAYNRGYSRGYRLGFVNGERSGYHIGRRDERNGHTSTTFEWR